MSFFCPVSDLSGNSEGVCPSSFSFVFVAPADDGGSVCLLGFVGGYAQIRIFLFFPKNSKVIFR